ncbi:dysbindin protein homolog [Ischnura elegans]|uniref:dysbindin protein homolog n=1 Tax=Ischnura elegans TaxID=197161 RepID=UPI001ED8744C|nr:dysbindin protein homolog [Ischnura elegans]
MFDSIRDKIHTVHEGIAASFRGLNVNDAPRRSARTSNNVNYNAGADVLNKYQSNWSELHQLTEENSKKAEGIDATIKSLHESFEKQWVAVGHICASISTVPQLLNGVQELMEQIGTLQTLFADVEGSLLKLEDMIETQELQEKQLDHRFQLAMFKEKKLGEIEQVKEELVRNHAEKVRDHEQRRQQVLKERQEAFGKVFEEDMQQYKTSGRIPKVESVLEHRGLVEGPAISLDDVELDDGGEEAKAALDEFLMQ